MTAPEPVAILKNVTRRYGPLTAVDGLSVSIRVGEVTGFLGPNGAGKTTTLKLLVGLLRPSAGTVRVAGADPALVAKCRRSIGYLPDDAPLDLNLSVAECLRGAAQIHGLRRHKARARIDATLERCGLSHKRNALCGTLSRGYRQRVGLAQAMVHAPSLLVLDEPMSGLDPNQAASLRDLIRALSDDCAVLLSSHRLAEIERIADRVLILYQGCLVSDTPLSRDAVPAQQALFRSGDPAQAIRTLLAEIPAFSDTELVPKRGDEYALYFEGNDVRCAAVAEAIVAQGWSLSALGARPGQLEARFAELTQGKAP